MTNLTSRLEEFEREPPADLFGDPMWRLPADRIARFLADVCRQDIMSLIRDGAPRSSISQLERCVPSIAANIAEGYSRFSGKERARYYEIALGSARESRERYRDVRSWLGIPAATERGMLLTRIIKVLTVAIPRDRAGESERRMRQATLERTNSAPAPAPAPAPSTSTSNQQPPTSTPIPDSAFSPSRSGR